MSDANQSIALPSAFTISVVESVYEQIKLIADAEQHLKVDASAVQVVDTAAMQLMSATQKRLADNGGALEWVNVSEQLKKAAADLGLTQDLPGIAE